MRMANITHPPYLKLGRQTAVYDYTKPMSTIIIFSYHTFFYSIYSDYAFCSHTFRRTFACLLRKVGVDIMTIKDLGRWESLEMVQRYTRSVTFEDSMKHYKAPLS
jgi:integrase